MSEKKYNKAEECKQKEGIVDFRWFSSACAYCPEGPVAMIKRKQGLYYTGYPEKADKAGDEEEHLPVSYIDFFKVAFCEYYADYEEDPESQQLEKLESGDIVYKLNLLQPVTLDDLKCRKW